MTEQPLIRTSAVVVIPARLQSTRLPRKVLLDIAGKPMLQHVCERASQAQLPSAVWVTTDSQEVGDAVSGWGFQAVLTDPALPSGTARIASIVYLIEADFVINLQGDEPLVDPALVDAVVKALIETGSDIVTPVYPINDLDTLLSPHVVKVVRAHDGRALYFSRSPIPHVRGLAQARWLEAASFWGHVGIYGYRREVLTNYGALPESSLEQAERLEQLRFLQAGYQIQTVETASRPIAVDTPQDLEHVREIMGGGQE